ncbi:hypothetical protein ABIB50_005148 [Mucilaginibacter sp. UYCu711]
MIENVALLFILKCLKYILSSPQDRFCGGIHEKTHLADTENKSENTSVGCIDKEELGSL